MVSTTLWGLRMLSTAYVDLLIVFEDLPKERNMERKTHPLLWIPSSYIVMGVIYTMVVTVGAIMYRNMGLSVKEAAFITSSLGIPYTIKPLWASFLEMFKTKKFFVVLMQLILGAMLVLLGMALGMDDFVLWTSACLWVIGFAGSTQDIATDGIWVTGMSTERQAKYAGLQGMFWNIGPVIAQGPIIWLTGVLHDKMGMSWAESWRVVMVSTAAVMFAASFWHMRFLPRGSIAKDAPKSPADAVRIFVDTLLSFFKKKQVWLLITFVFLYRTSQGLLDKIAPLFMIDSLENGGLGLSNEMLGTLVGVLGTPASILGGILSGFYVAKKGLKKPLLFLCACVNIPNATYIYLAAFQPKSIYVIGFIVVLEKFFWGVGAVGHMIYMMSQVAPGPYKTAHYAFATSLMGLCMISTGMISGFVYEALGGYIPFFIFVIVATIPSFIATFFAPFHHPDVNQPGAEAETPI
jgi:MFS transporter, PAT family, beta-lactamase induction signal transducer AmpG